MFQCISHHLQRELTCSLFKNTRFYKAIIYGTVAASQSMKATANKRQTHAHALQIGHFNKRLLRFATYSTVMQHIMVLTNVKNYCKPTKLYVLYVMMQPLYHVGSG